MAEAKLFETIRDAAPSISVGLLTADLLDLGAQLRLLESSGVRLVHFDVMDGRFCPAITVGAPVVKALLGPTGNLRSPTMRVGKTLLIGFNEEAFRRTLL